MRRIFTISTLAIVLALGAVTSGAAYADGFNAVVKAIEQFYHVKHESIPLLARAGMKAVRTGARIKGGDARRLAEAGSVRVVVFEDQNFDSHGQIANFKALVQNTLERDWSPLIQTLAPRDEEQAYIYVRDTGEKFQVLVVNIERRDATVVQASVAPNVFADLMRDPSGMGKALTEEATVVDP
jgi:hypothetical protein